MKIIQTYSHLNGLEFLLVHKPILWKEIKAVIKAIDAEACRTKVSNEKGMKGKLLYSPIAMNANFKELLRIKNWKESRVSYWVTKSEKLIRKTLTMASDEQKRKLKPRVKSLFTVIIKRISLKIALLLKFSLANTLLLLTICLSSILLFMLGIILMSGSRFCR